MSVEIMTDELYKNSYYAEEAIKGVSTACLIILMSLVYVITISLHDYYLHIIFLNALTLHVCTLTLL
jgi:hypothetical protein